MSWGRVDDRLDDNPKFCGIDPLAAGLWLLCLPRALREDDGYVPAGHPQRFLGRGAARTAAELVARGLWEVSDQGGWDYHDFDQYRAPETFISQRRAAGRASAAARREKFGTAIPRGAPNEPPNGVRPNASEHDRAERAPNGPNPVPVPVPVTTDPVDNPESLDRSSTGSVVPAVSSNGTLVGAYVDACRELGVPAGTKRQLGHIGKLAKDLEQVYSHDAMVAALRELARKGDPPAWLEGLAGIAARHQRGITTARLIEAPIYVETQNSQLARQTDLAERTRRIRREAGEEDLL